MRTPSNYRRMDTAMPLGLAGHCAKCVHVRDWEAGRLVCLKHFAFVKIWNVCDDYRQGEGRYARYGLIDRAPTEDERSSLSSGEIVELDVAKPGRLRGNLDQMEEDSG